MGVYVEHIKKLMREPVVGTLIDRMVLSHEAGVNMDLIADSSEPDRIRALVGFLFGLESAVLDLAAEVERLRMTIGELPFDGQPPRT